MIQFLLQAAVPNTPMEYGFAGFVLVSMGAVCWKGFTMVSTAIKDTSDRMEQRMDKQTDAMNHLTHLIGMLLIPMIKDNALATREVQDVMKKITRETSK